MNPKEKFPPTWVAWSLVLMVLWIGVMEWRFHSPRKKPFLREPAWFDGQTNIMLQDISGQVFEARQLNPNSQDYRLWLCSGETNGIAKSLEWRLRGAQFINSTVINMPAVLAVEDDRQIQDNGPAQLSGRDDLRFEP